MTTRSIDVFRLARIALDAGGIRDHDVSVVLADHCVPGYVGYTLFVLARGDGRLLTVVKATTQILRAAALEQEHENLVRLRHEGGSALRQSVATPLAFGQEGPATFLALAPLPGKPVQAGLFGRRRVAERIWQAFEQAVDRLGDLSRLQGSPAVRDAAAEVAAFRASHKRSAALDALLDASVRRLSERRVPLPPAHGDCCTDNLLLADDGRLAIVDWEYPLEASWPLSDLLTLLTSLAGRPGRGGAAALARSYRKLLFAPGPHSARIRRAADRHRRAIGLDPDLVLPASVLAWVSYANRKQAELDAMQQEAGSRLEAHRLTPLIMIEDQRCLNLEILAEQPDRYLLSSLAEDG